MLVFVWKKYRYLWLWRITAFSKGKCSLVQRRIALTCNFVLILRIVCFDASLFLGCNCHIWKSQAFAISLRLPQDLKLIFFPFWPWRLMKGLLAFSYSVQLWHLSHVEKCLAHFSSCLLLLVFSILKSSVSW